MHTLLLPTGPQGVFFSSSSMFPVTVSLCLSWHLVPSHPAVSKLWFSHSDSQGAECTGREWPLQSPYPCKIPPHRVSRRNPFFMSWFCTLNFMAHGSYPTTSPLFPVFLSSRKWPYLLLQRVNLDRHSWTLSTLCLSYVHKSVFWFCGWSWWILSFLWPYWGVGLWRVGVTPPTLSLSTTAPTLLFVAGLPHHPGAIWTWPVFFCAINYTCGDHGVKYPGMSVMATSIARLLLPGCDLLSGFSGGLWGEMPSIEDGDQCWPLSLLLSLLTKIKAV